MRGNDVRARRVDHLQRAVRGVVAVDILSPDVDGKELRAKKPLHARKIGLSALVGCGDLVAVDSLRSDVVVRVDQYRVTRNAGDLRLGNRLGARRLGRDRKNSRGKKSGGGERAESAQGGSFQNRAFLNNNGRIIPAPQKRRSPK